MTDPLDFDGLVEIVAGVIVENTLRCYSGTDPSHIWRGGREKARREAEGPPPMTSASAKDLADRLTDIADDYGPMMGNRATGALEKAAALLTRYAEVEGEVAALKEERDAANARAERLAGALWEAKALISGWASHGQKLPGHLKLLGQIDAAITEPEAKGGGSRPRAGDHGED